MNERGSARVEAAAAAAESINICAALEIKHHVYLASHKLMASAAAEAARVLFARIEYNSNSNNSSGNNGNINNCFSSL